jgi:hypothetical protein
MVASCPSRKSSTCNSMHGRNAPARLGPLCVPCFTHRCARCIFGLTPAIRRPWPFPPCCLLHWQQVGHCLQFRNAIILCADARARRSVSVSKLGRGACQEQGVCCLQYSCSALCAAPHTHSQREVAVAHSGAAWAQLKDLFTLNSADTPVVLEDSGSLGHKVKVGWNNGAFPKAASLPPNVTRVPWQVSGAFVMRCGGCLKIEPWRVNKTCLRN